MKKSFKNRFSCEKKKLQTIESLTNKTDKNFCTSCGQVKRFKMVHGWETSTKMHVRSQITTINQKEQASKLFKEWGKIQYKASKNYI